MVQFLLGACRERNEEAASIQMYYYEAQGGNNERALPCSAAFALPVLVALSSTATLPVADTKICSAGNLQLHDSTHDDSLRKSRSKIGSANRGRSQKIQRSANSKQKRANNQKQKGSKPNCNRNGSRWCANVPGAEVELRRCTA